MKLYAFQGLCRLQILTLRTVSIAILFLGGFCRGYSGGHEAKSDRNSLQRSLQGIRRLVNESVTDLKRNKEPVPEPISTRPYSGKFVVRVPPEVHRMLAIQAAESGISINRLVSSKLS